MYTLFLFACIALVVLSPLALNAWLSGYEQRAKRPLFSTTKGRGPGIAWAPVRLPD